FGLQIKLGSGLARDLRSVTVSLLVLSVALAGGAFARPKRRLLVAALVLTSGLCALAVGSTPLLVPEIGWICILFELGAGCMTWLVAAGIARARKVTLERWQGAGVAAAGALASGAAPHLTCPAAHAGVHLLVF